MSNHQASQQMVGYLYQMQYALKLLLDNDNCNSQISIEKFDDVAFVEEGTPKKFIQLKHHGKSGKLTDGSTDLWRTLKVWLDEIKKSPGLLKDTKFLIITTAEAPKGTAASYLKSDVRNEEEAYSKLRNICNSSRNKTNAKFYNSFLETREDILRQLISKIYVIDNASNIIDVEKEIRSSIKYSCIKKFENQVY
ncbi:hypothetical protein [uncultured Dubosiella sp.]|uniref:hypothetical protein n=1 Tax=uncultured Dubosiella sp. TaxID=1937011 RepID=UPI0025B61303|nr:hypothetical protein [uncultured Dubosiella sp.]